MVGHYYGSAKESNEKTHPPPRRLVFAHCTGHFSNFTDPPQTSPPPPFCVTPPARTLDCQLHIFGIIFRVAGRVKCHKEGHARTFLTSTTKGINYFLAPLENCETQYVISSCVKSIYLRNLELLEVYSCSDVQRLLSYSPATTDSQLTVGKPWQDSVTPGAICNSILIFFF